MILQCLWKKNYVNFFQCFFLNFKQFKNSNNLSQTQSRSPHLCGCQEIEEEEHTGETKDIGLLRAVDRIAQVEVHVTGQKKHGDAYQVL